MPDEIDELLRELDRQLANVDEEFDDRTVACAAAAIRKLREENEALRADFERYAQHLPLCEWAEWRGPPCQCGADEARERWAKKETT